jgi:hypothetical protein
MAVLGGIVSALPPANAMQKVLYIGAFATLGGWAWILVIRQAKQNSKSEAELREGISRLATESAEITRLQTANNGLERQLLELANLNTSLVRENISTVTGGDSFCWMGVNFQFGRPSPFFKHSGKFTLYEVNVRIVDLNKMRGKIAKKEPIALSDDLTIPVGEIHVNTAGCAERFSLPFSESPAQDFNVFFLARNGRWTELLRLRKVSDRWLSAIQVSWQYRADGSVVSKEPIFEQVDEGYPRNDEGLVDWG